MKLQARPYWCGPASIQAALEFFGVRKTQGEIASRIDCNPTDGTNEMEVCRALLSWGFQVDVLDHGGDYARTWLKTCLGPAILCVDAHEHWVCCLGVFGDVFTVWDPQNSKDNKRSMGLHFYRWEQLKSRWQFSGGFFGISITR